MSGIMYTVDGVVNLNELWGNNMLVNINTPFGQHVIYGKAGFNV